MSNDCCEITVVETVNQVTVTAQAPNEIIIQEIVDELNSGESITEIIVNEFPPAEIVIEEPGPQGIRGIPGVKGDRGDPGPPGLATSSWIRQLIDNPGTVNLNGGSNYIEIDCTDGDQTIVLPDVTTVYTIEFLLFRVSEGENIIRIQPQAGQTINDEPYWELFYKGEALRLLAVAGNTWRIA